MCISGFTAAFKFTVVQTSNAALSIGDKSCISARNAETLFACTNHRMRTNVSIIQCRLMGQGAHSVSGPKWATRQCVLHSCFHKPMLGSGSLHHSWQHETHTTHAPHAPSGLFLCTSSMYREISLLGTRFTRSRIAKRRQHLADPCLDTCTFMQGLTAPSDPPPLQISWGLSPLPLPAEGRQGAVPCIS